jgi:hypothetical protein
MDCAFSTTGEHLKRFFLFTRKDLGYTADVSLLPMYCMKTTIDSLQRGNSLHMDVISWGKVTQCPLSANVPLERCTNET